MRVLIFLFFLLMVYTCPDPCLEVFDTETGLSVHQNKCNYVNTHDPGMDRAVEACRERKRLKREQKAATALHPMIPEAPQVRMDFLPKYVSDPLAEESCWFGIRPQEDVGMPYQEPELDPQPPAQTPPADVTTTGRPIRAKQLTWKLLQQLPPPPIEFEEPAQSDASTEDRDELEEEEYTWQSMKTIKNTFGISVKYTGPSLYHSSFCRTFASITVDCTS
ncbi:hypothetical protein B0H13DRAFT_1877266 [Mycena leptocephala]|nr:hypothetical protein B0H13DRAFT_1877266 [Mycena leptocephala]